MQTDHPQLPTTRRHLGELGVMSAQVEAHERQILAHAETLHAETLKKIDAARASALASDADGKAYQELIAERGRLERVIAQARSILTERATMAD